MYKSKLLWLVLFIGAGVWWQWHTAHLPPSLESMGHSVASVPQGGRPRLALVIGNGTGYKGGGFKSLLTPENDANEMARTLSSLGFQVIKAINADKATIENRVIEFTDTLQSAGGGVGLFYFIGHGVGLKHSKRNFLIPVGARIGKEADVPYQAVEANWVVERMQESNAKGVNLVFLDACRSYDVPSLTQNFGNGLAEMPNPQGTLIVYATAPGKVAYTSPRENHSVFTANLLQLLQDETKASTSIASLMIDLTAAVEPHSERLIAEVRQQSPRDAEGLEPQTPWVAMSLKQHFCFREPCALASNNTNAAQEQMLQTVKDLQERQAVLEQMIIKQRQQVVTPPRQAFEPEMVQITGGTFMMGSPEGEGDSDQRPQHEVTVGDFAIGKYEVTVKQYLACVQAGGCKPPVWQEPGSSLNINTGSDDYYKKFGAALTGHNYPIIGVSWDNANEYVVWLSGVTGKTYRLPTEAEWEYACRGGAVGETYCGGNDVDSVAWYNGNSGGKTHPVGIKAANGFGLFDMSGNVWEWTCSQYNSNGYRGKETTCAEKGNSDARAVRGGSWSFEPGGVRAAFRPFGAPSFRFNNLGFRAVQD